MVQEETNRVKGPIKLSDIKCNRESKNEQRSNNNDSEKLAQ